MRRRRDAHGAAVVDFVLVMMILVPLFLGIVQLSLVLLVRNTLAAAASEGARYGATLDHDRFDGAERARAEISGALAANYAEHVTSSYQDVNGAPGVVVRIEAVVPTLGLGGPGITLVVTGHATREVE